MNANLEISQYQETLTRIPEMDKFELLDHLQILYGAGNLQIDFTMAELREEATRQTHIFFLYEEETTFHLVFSLLSKLKGLFPVFQSS